MDCGLLRVGPVPGRVSAAPVSSDTRGRAQRSTRLHSPRKDTNDDMPTKGTLTTTHIEEAAVELHCQRRRRRECLARLYAAHQAAAKALAQMVALESQHGDEPEALLRQALAYATSATIATK